MATISKTIRYDLTAGDHLTGPMTAAARAMDAASRNARALDRALASQRKAADVSAGASLALARADKILGEAEDELSGKAAIARRELERQGRAAEVAARRQEAAAARARRASAALGGAGAGAGLFAAGAAGVALAGPLGAATAAVGTFGVVAAGAYKKANDNLKALQAAEKAYNSAVTPAAKAAALKKVQEAQQALTGSQRTLLNQEGQLKALWDQTVSALTPLVAQVTRLAIPLVQDLVPAFTKLAQAGGQVIGAFLKPFDAFARSAAFTQIINQMSAFAVQAGRIAGPAVVQLITALLTLFVKVMPAGIRILAALLPAITLLVTDLTPVIVAVANVTAATVAWLDKNHLLVPAIAALTVGLTAALIAIDGASAPIWLIVAAVAAVAVGIVELARHWGTIWHGILVVVMGVWNWIKANWPLLLAIITGPIGLAILWVTQHFGAITGAVKTVLNAVAIAWNATWNTLKAAFRSLIVDGILTPLGWIVHAAATAFGWVPGLGGKLKTAAKAFDTFKADVNAALGGINGRTVSVSVAMTSATNPYGGINPKKAAGGRITGPGGPRDDRAGLFALSNNEWVIRADSAARYGYAAMDAVNRGTAVIGYAAGGGVNVKASAPSYKTIEASLLASVTTLAQAFARAAQAVAGAPGPASASAAQAQAYAKSRLGAYGWGAGQMPPLILLWNQESGWNRLARNPSSGAYGIPQALPPGKMGAAANPPTSSASAQINWGLGYIRGRYGSPAGAWAHERAYNWYDRGGLLMPGWTMAYNGTGAAETVLPPGGEGPLVAELRALRAEVRQLTGVAAAIPSRTGAHVAGAVGSAGADAAFRRRYPGR